MHGAYCFVPFTGKEAAANSSSKVCKLSLLALRREAMKSN